MPANETIKRKLIDVSRLNGLLRNQCAYVLATCEWETNHTFDPVKEAYYLKSKAEPYRKKLRYYPWYGRGLVQLTWEENYKKAGAEIGVNLIANPDLAMEPDNAVRIAVLGMKHGWFTTKKLSDYITLQRSDFTNARRIINGTDKAKEISDLAKKYDAELKAEGYGSLSTPKPIIPIQEKPMEEFETPLAEPSKAITFNWFPWALGAVVIGIVLWLFFNLRF